MDFEENKPQLQDKTSRCMMHYGLWQCRLRKCRRVISDHPLTLTVHIDSDRRTRTRCFSSRTMNPSSGGKCSSDGSVVSKLCSNARSRSRVSSSSTAKCTHNLSPVQPGTGAVQNAGLTLRRVFSSPQSPGPQPVTSIQINITGAIKVDRCKLSCEAELLSHFCGQGVF